MTKVPRVLKVSLWAGPIAVVVVVFLGLWVSGNLTIEYQPPDDPPSSGSSFEEVTPPEIDLSDTDYTDLSERMVSWSDSCETLFIDEIWELADLGSAEGELKGENDAEFPSVSCTGDLPLTNCIEGDRSIAVSIEVDPFESESQAYDYYARNFRGSNDRDRQLNDPDELPGPFHIELSSPWDLGEVHDFGALPTESWEAVALSDFYVVKVILLDTGGRDDTCEHRAQESAQRAAETLMPALYASIEERLESGE